MSPALRRQRAVATGLIVELACVFGFYAPFLTLVKLGLPSIPPWLLAAAY